MKIIVIHAKPMEKAKEYNKYGGAWFRCYIDYVEKDGATIIAKYYITKLNFKIISTDKKVQEVATMAGLTKEEKKYFKEAREYGYSLIAHLYPKKTNNKVYR